MRFQLLGLSLFLVGLTAGCGQGTDPIVALGDPTQSFTSSMTLPYSTNPLSFTGYSATSTDGSGFDFTFSATGLPVLAPAAGTVISIDTSTSSVIILHNVHVSSRIKGVTPSGIVVGSIVQQGGQIGTNSTTSTRLSVIVDNAYVCPLSYLTSGARSTLVTTITGASTLNPCNQ